ncbi:hypothetical protein NQ317_011318 [Molorchus minor]|uniref:Lipase domain-containing protein n=1 Tax=Molorchus minor TaxID=1323400 RepID=A0ABQ9IZA3_9CUCU|nr:hypothetical protein NQ317_011318 [Molorchus minor]
MITYLIYFGCYCNIISRSFVYAAKEDMANKKVLDTEKLKEFYRTLPPVDFTLAKAEKTDIIYKLFNDSKQESGKVLNEGTVAGEGLNKSIPTVLLVHGWTTDDTSPWYKPLKDEYFKLGPHNIIYINWSKAGNKSYDISSANIAPVGKYMAQFLIASGIPQDNIHIIGHSLGSQLASFIGKSMFELTGKKIGRITALDPAGPKFENPLMTPDKKLTETDAEFVDVIHTDVQLSGYAAPIGHVDYYPNDGAHQPGCPSREIDDNCSHARSTIYFIESVSKKSKAREVIFKQTKDFIITLEEKNNAKEIIFGQHVDQNVRGTYSFSTNSEKPFLK